MVVGDLVQVTGGVSRVRGDRLRQTQISNRRQVPTAARVRARSVEPTDVTFPVADLSDFERFEGMLVTFDQTLP